MYDVWLGWLGELLGLIETFNLWMSKYKQEGKNVLEIQILRK